MEVFKLATNAGLLFLWNLFEGVPKFSGDAFEQDVLGASLGIECPRCLVPEPLGFG